MPASRDERHSTSNAFSVFPVVTFEHQHTAVDETQPATCVVPSYAAVGSPHFACFEWDASQPILSPVISARPPSPHTSASPPSPVRVASPPSPIIPFASTPSTSSPAKRPRPDDEASQGSPKRLLLAEDAGLSPPDIAAPEVQPKRKRVRKSTKDPSHIPRPSNCFILYKNDYIRRLYESGYEAMSKDITKVIGAQWRLLPENERRYWKDKAKEVKDDHRLSNPGYRYKPERKKTGRPPKGESRNERNLENARDQEEKENDQRLGDDNVARPFIGSTEDNHATGNTRAIAGPQRVSLSTVPLISRQSQNNSSPPLHSAVRAPRAETSTEWCYAGQVMPYFQPRPASVLHPAFQQARAPRPVTTYRGQPARPDPSLSQVVNEAANHGLALPYVANSSTYYLSGNHAQYPVQAPVDGFQVMAPAQVYNATQCLAYVPPPSMPSYTHPALYQHPAAAQYTSPYVIPTPGSSYGPNSAYTGAPAFSHLTPPDSTTPELLTEDVALALSVFEAQGSFIPQQSNSPDLNSTLASATRHTPLEESSQGSDWFSDMFPDFV